jgi:cobalt-zinc-cadmium efflux system outer membrane protein
MGGWQYQLSGAGAPLNQGIYQVTFAVPLWNRNQGAIRAAQATVGESRAQFGDVRNQLANDAANAVGRYISARTLVEAYEERILPKARETQRLTQQLYGEGQIDFLRLLETQRTLFQANLEYVNAQEDRWTAAADVAGLLQSDRFP